MGLHCRQWNFVLKWHNMARNSRNPVGKKNCFLNPSTHTSNRMTLKNSSSCFTWNATHLWTPWGLMVHLWSTRFLTFKNYTFRGHGTLVSFSSKFNKISGWLPRQVCQGKFVRLSARGDFESSHVFCVDVGTNSSTNWLVCIAETVCLLRGTDWIFTYNAG